MIVVPVLFCVETSGFPKDWLARTRYNMSEWGDTSSTINIQLSMFVLVQIGLHHHPIAK